MGGTNSKVEQGSKVERKLDNGDIRAGFIAKIENGSSRLSDKEDSEVLRKNPPRPRRVPQATKGEQVAAGWPTWLATVAGEAIEGWQPRGADSFEKIDVIGKGTYSTVYKARDCLSGKFVALKKVRFDNLESESVGFMAREILILRNLDHPNIIKLEGLVTSRMSLSLYLIFEYMEHDLTGIASLPGVKFTEPQIKCYMHQLLSGLEYCHSRGVLHRDIKGANLLIDGSGTLKIADFGLSTFFDHFKNLPLTSRCVTLWYRPPELLLGEIYYGVAVDLWSTGCVLGELYAGRPIMPGKTEVEQLHKIYKLCGSPSDDYWRSVKLPNAALLKPREPYKRRLAETFEDIPPAALGLMDTLLSMVPEHRGTVASALESEFFNTKPFACDPSSLPKYPPSKEIDVKRQDKADRQTILIAGGYRGEYDRKGSKQLQAPPAPEANAGTARSMQHHGGFKGKDVHSSGLSDNVDRIRKDIDLQIHDALQRARLEKFSPRKVQVQGSQVTDDAVHSGPSHVPYDGAQILEEFDLRKIEFEQDVWPEQRKARIQAQQTATQVYSGPAIVPRYNVDQLLEEHDRHIQESAKKVRLGKRRGKIQVQEKQLKVNPVTSGPSILSVNNVDQLLEEHDRQIQESTQRFRLEKKRSGKKHVQGIHIQP